jgi:hypothetical protein
MESRLNDKDFKRLMELAIQKDMEQELDYEDVRLMALSMGIDEHEWKYALRKLREEKENKAQAKENRRRLLKNIAQYSFYTVVGLCVLLGIIYLISKPKAIFKGNVKINIATQIDQQSSQPVDDLATVRLLLRPDYVCFTKFTGLEDKYAVKWDFYRPDGTFYESFHFQMQGEYAYYYTYASFRIPLSEQVGIWQVKIFLDSQQVATKNFEVALGEVELKMGREVVHRTLKGESNRFSRSQTASIACLIDFDLLGLPGLANLKWFAPVNKFYKNSTFRPSVSTDNPQGYIVWSDKTTAEMPTGDWRVEAFYNEVKIGETTFVLTE